MVSVAYIPLGGLPIFRPFTLNSSNVGDEGHGMIIRPPLEADG